MNSDRTVMQEVSFHSRHLRVSETSPWKDPRWQTFVDGHPNGSIYHHPAWLEVLEREYQQKGTYLICEDSNNEVLAILPLLSTRGFPFGLGRNVAGRRLSSLPRTPVAGPLSRDSGATSALLREAVRLVSIDPGVQLQIKMQSTELDGLLGDIVCTPWRLSYLLRLSPDSDRTFRISNSEDRASVKRAVNKARRLGVYTRPAESEIELREWYRLYLETMRHNFVPPRPYRFFVALWELLKPRGLMQLTLAEQQTRGQRRIIAGAIFLMFGRTVSFAFSGSRRGDLFLRPNDLIQWQAINQACHEGFGFFDFGEVPEGCDDLARFKSKWGAEPVRLYRYYYPYADAKNSSVVSQAHPGGLAKVIWRRLPLAATVRLGDRIYTYL